MPTLIQQTTAPTRLSKNMKTAAVKNPLYAQVHKILLDRVLAGEWQPGEKIPAEPELARQTGVSIGTLRHAVDLLVSENILVRREGAGTFVSTYRTSGYWNRFQPFESVDASTRYDLRRFILFECVPAPAEAAAAVGIAAGSTMFRILRHMVRTLKNAPERIEIVDELFLRCDAFKGLSESHFLTRFLPSDSLYKFYDREFGVVITRHKCIVSFEHLFGEALTALKLSAPMQTLTLTRTSYAFGSDPVEYRIYRIRAEEARLCFDL